MLCDSMQQPDTAHLQQPSQWHTPFDVACPCLTRALCSSQGRHAGTARHVATSINRLPATRRSMDISTPHSKSRPTAHATSQYVSLRRQRLRQGCPVIDAIYKHHALSMQVHSHQKDNPTPSTNQSQCKARSFIQSTYGPAPTLLQPTIVL